MGVGQVLTMPLLFAGWLRIISRLNPPTYVVDALRTFMPAGSMSSFGLSQDYGVILPTTTARVLIGARLYPRLAT
jgi:ABC-2 type transport system permease protein